MSRGIQCSFMSFISACLTLLKSYGTYLIKYIAERESFLFKSLNNYRHLRIKDLPKEFFIGNSSINVQLFNSREQ